MPRGALGSPRPIHQREAAFLDTTPPTSPPPPLCSRSPFVILSLNPHSAWERLLNICGYFPVIALLCLSPQLEGKPGAGQNFCFFLLCSRKSSPALDASLSPEVELVLS